MGIVRGVMDFWFPWTCAVCRAGFEGPGPLCAGCFSALEKLEGEPCCEVCAMSLPMHGGPCAYCRGKGWPNFERVVRLTSFHDPVRVLVHHLKYHRRWGAGEELAKRLLAQERVKAVLQETQVLVAVPLHWRRQFVRGYNQAEVIARWLGARCDIPVARPVRRVRDTETQTHLHSHAKREKNLHEAFALRGDGRAVAGRHVTIVDDVWTTGATMQAMARVIKGARPASLSAIVVAAADPRGVERGGGGRRVEGIAVEIPKLISQVSNRDS
jgi:ComF family protein